MSTINTYLHTLTPILPAKAYPQGTLVNWMLAAHQQAALLTQEHCEKRRLKRFALSESYISVRYMECPDAGGDWQDHEIYRIDQLTPQGLDIKSRADFFSSRALKRLQESYSKRDIPDHFIHVTCTGYVSPSAPQLYFAQAQMAPSITHAYHMGCYASLPALRLARALSSDGKTVDIFHNEMCSLHMNPTNHSPEQIVVETLFADGHINYRVSTEKKGMRIIGIKEKIIPDSALDMSWIPSASGMKMTLSREVPVKIQDNILPFVMEMVQEFGLDLALLIKHAVFAIHPGGPRIIELVRTKLELREEQIKESNKILYERGNMSSATLPHIWHEITQNNYPSGTYVISLAFGPGLTVFGSIFEVV